MVEKDEEQQEGYWPRVADAVADAVRKDDAAAMYREI